MSDLVYHNDTKLKFVGVICHVWASLHNITKLLTSSGFNHF